MIKKHSRRGFTLVELIVVIVVLSIIAAISVLAFIGSQATSNDSVRSTKSTAIAEALEKYYEKNQEYPSEESLSNQTTAALKTKLGITTDDTFVLPGGTSGTSTLVGAHDNATATPTRLVYTGMTTDPTKSTQCRTTLAGYCDAFTLSYANERDGVVKTIESRNSNFSEPDDPSCTQAKGCLAAPTTPSVVGAFSGSNVVFTASAATCTEGTVEYKIRHNTSPSFLGWAWYQWSENTTAQRAKGSNKDFYSQVSARCVDGDQTSASTSSAVHYLYAARELGIPSPVYVDNLSTTSQKVSWQAVPNAASYTIAQSTNPSSYPAPTCTITVSSYCDFLSLNPSTRYYYEVIAYPAVGSTDYEPSKPGYGDGTTSSVSSCAPPTAPAGIAHSSTTSTIQTSWSASSVTSGCGPITYTVAYAGLAALPACTSISTTTCTRSGLPSNTCYNITITAITPYKNSSTTTTACTAPTPPAPSIVINGCSSLSKTGSCDYNFEVRGVYTTSGNTYSRTGCSNAAVNFNASTGEAISTNCPASFTPCKTARTITVNRVTPASPTLSASKSVAAYNGAKPTVNGVILTYLPGQQKLKAEWNWGADTTYIQMRYQKIRDANNVDISGSTPTFSIENADRGNLGDGAFAFNQTVQGGGSNITSGRWKVWVYASNCRYKHIDSLNSGTYNTADYNVPDSGTDEVVVP